MKKNFMKVLALTGLLALSLGAISSCGNTTEAPKGPTGDKGQKGD